MFENCICTTDFKIEGVPCPISFIWYRSVHNIGSVLHGFDIDICQVAMDVRERELIVSPGVKRAIATKQATVLRKFAFCKTVPAKFEVRRMTATFRRMMKYRDRGFSFATPPSISFPEDI
jgi:hypothetical protein